MQYSIPYIILIVFYGISAFLRDSWNVENVQKRIDALCILVFVFFFGLRGYVYDDWIVYAEVFRKADFSTFSILLNTSNMEPGFLLWLTFVKSLVNNYHFFVFLCCIINTILLIRFLNRYTINLPLGLMLYVCMGGLLMSMNLMRNSIAILLFINSISFIQNRQFVKYFAVCILATTFHISAVLYMPLYFFLHRNCNKWLYLSLFLIANTVLLMHIPILQSIIDLIVGYISPGMQMHINAYMERTSDVAFNISIGYLERFFSGMMVFLFMDKLKSIRQENVMFINSILLYYMVLFLFSEFEELSLRLSFLFIFAYWILWADMIECFTYDNNRKLFIAFIYIYCLFKIIGNTNFITARYDNLLFGIQSYQERLYIHNRNNKD